MIVITLGQDGTNSTDQLIKYLSLIPSDEKPLDERKQQLEDEYRIPMSDEMEEEMSGVCNMGEAIRRKAEAEGMKKGMEKGESRPDRPRTLLRKEAVGGIHL